MTLGIEISTAPIWTASGVAIEKDGMTIKAMLEKAGLDWTTIKEPIMNKAGKEIAGTFMLTRSDNGEEFGLIGDRFTQVQNEEVLSALSDVLKDGKAEMKALGSMDAGRTVWAVLSLNQSFNIAKGDVVSAFVLVTIPHRVGSSIEFQLIGLREASGVTMPIPDGSFRVRHNANFEDKKVWEEAAEAIEDFRLKFDAFEKECKRMVSAKIEEIDAWNFFAGLFDRKAVGQFDPDGRRRVMKELWGSYLLAPAAKPGTGWGALMAVLFFLDHTAATSSDRRMTSAFIGPNAKRKRDAIKAATA